MVDCSACKKSQVIEEKPDRILKIVETINHQCSTKVCGLTSAYDLAWAFEPYTEVKTYYKHKDKGTNLGEDETAARLKAQEINASIALRRQQDAELGSDAFRKGMELLKRAWRCSNNENQAQRAKNSFAEATKQFECAVTLDPNNGIYKNYLKVTENKQKGDQHLAKAKEMHEATTTGNKTFLASMMKKITEALLCAIGCYEDGARLASVEAVYVRWFMENAQVAHNLLVAVEKSQNRDNRGCGRFNLKLTTDVETAVEAQEGARGVVQSPVSDIKDEDIMLRSM